MRRLPAQPLLRDVYMCRGEQQERGMVGFEEYAAAIFGVGEESQR
jgi:hypothetical protein